MANQCLKEPVLVNNDNNTLFLVFTFLKIIIPLDPIHKKTAFIYVICSINVD